MQIKIIHETEYSFSKEVFLEPHYLRFRPQNMPFLNLVSHQLDLSIDPSGISEQLDAEGNLVHFCWFDGMHKSIHIISISEIKITPFKPFNFLVYPPSCNQVPFEYPRQLLPILALYFASIKISNNLLDYGRGILKTVGSNTIPFLLQLTIQIHEDFIIENREKGVPFDPDTTFEGKRGSCRDLSWMQIQLLRNLGLASRFVSGYYYVDVENPQYELHAWVEVFLPGAGWIGFDPSNGIATANMHLPICSSLHYENTMPVSGSVRGSAQMQMKSSLIMEMIH